MDQRAFNKKGVNEMLMYPHIDPIALKIGPMEIHWYGIMYLVAFASAWFLAWIRARKPNSGWTLEQISDLIFYGAVGAVLGGRIGYMLFYDFSNFIHQPWIIIRVWDGGMSFHGGLIGAMVAILLFGRKYHKRFFEVGDFTAPLVPLGLAAGRIGNFINGELWGRVTTMPWGMVYPNAGPLPRHPSELYEAFLEGIVLFLIMWLYSAKPKPRMAVTALFLLGYGVIRFTVEFFRQPDPQLGFVAFGWMTQGQLLSIPMIVIGAILLVYAYYHQTKETVTHEQSL
jgi:phosphatidylglycerol:prolipoprotein diacylglycerol transferase